MNDTSVRARDIDVRIIENDSQTTVEIAGRVTIDSSPQLRRFLLRLLERKAGVMVVIDISKVSYLDTSGIAALLESLEATRARSVKLRLVGASGRVRILVELLELPRIFDAFGSEVVFT